MGETIKKKGRAEPVCGLVTGAMFRREVAKTVARGLSAWRSPSNAAVTTGSLAQESCLAPLATSRGCSAPTAEDKAGYDTIVAAIKKDPKSVYNKYRGRDWWAQCENKAEIFDSEEAQDPDARHGRRVQAALQGDREEPLPQAQLGGRLGQDEEGLPGRHCQAGGRLFRVDGQEAHPPARGAEEGLRGEPGEDPLQPARVRGLQEEDHGGGRPRAGAAQGRLRQGDCQVRGEDCEDRGGAGRPGLHYHRGVPGQQPGARRGD